MTDYAELKRLAEGAVHAGDHWGRRDSFERQLAKLVGPEVVLALISKLEQDEMHLRAFSSVAETAIAERNQFKAESERLNAENKQLILLECCGGTAEAAINLLAERDQLKAENERLERNRDMWKGQVERQAEELTALRGEVTEWKDTVKFNEKCWSEERGTMIDKLQESRMRTKELDLLFGRYIIAMRSALIEEEHGKGPAAAMEWIYNSLAGPGELPPEGETDSQAYFDREIVAVDNGMQEVMAFHEGRRAALGQGEQS